MLSTASKIVSREELAKRCEELRKEGKTIVTCNGSFDLFHYGHLCFLEEAKAQADVLIVGLNSDSSIKQYKSPLRPIIGQEQRAALLSADSDPTNSLTPALKPAFSETLASYRGGRIAEGSDGSVYPLRDGEDVSAGLKRTTTFRYSDLSDETIDETLAFFDRAAAPILEMTPDTVTSILTEEISACLSGVGTAEDCAAKIQSRVSIWLAENK